MSMVLFQWCPGKCFKWHEEILEYTLYKAVMPQNSCRSSWYFVLLARKLWWDWLSHSSPTRGNWWYEVGMSGCRGWECTLGVFWIFNEDWVYPVSYYIRWGSHSVFIFNKSCRCLTFHLVNFNTAFSIAFSKH